MNKNEKNLKSDIRKLIPTNIWKVLMRVRASVSEGIDQSLTGFLTGVIRPFPLTVVANVKGKINRTGRLDYPGHNILMKVDTHTQWLRLHACKKEPETVTWLENSCKEGDVFYDIGANVGAYSLVAHAIMKGNCKIYAFEPSFSTFTALCQNIQVNRYEEGIIPLQIALSERTNLLTFNYSDVTPGAAGHSQGVTSQDIAAEFKQTLLSFSLDDLIDKFGLEIPNHIKIDVDGAELEILKGGSTTFRNSAMQSVLIEVDERKYPENEIQKIMTDYGFKLAERHLRPNSKTLANTIFQKVV